MTSPDHCGDVGLVIAAAGSGERFGGHNKLLVPFAGKPLFLHVLERLLHAVPPDRTALVIDPALEDPFRAGLATLPNGRGVHLVAGGASRAESVLNGLLALPPELPLVAVQDAARPLTSLELFSRCIASARRHGSGVAARRVTDTIKISDPSGRVLHTPDRASLWAAETPQIFGLGALLAAYRQALRDGTAPTDDAGAIEHAGGTVQLVESTAPNPKVTYPGDIAASEQLLRHVRLP